MALKKFGTGKITEVGHYSGDESPKTVEAGQNDSSKENPLNRVDWKKPGEKNDGDAGSKGA